MQKMMKLSDTHYIGVDESDIKVGDIVAEKLLTGGYELFEIHTPNDIDEVRQKKVTDSTQAVERYYSATDGTIPFVYHKVKPLSLSEVEEAINGYSVEKLFKEWESKNGICYNEEESAFLAGFNAHKELVKDKFILSESDLHKILDMARESHDYLYGYSWSKEQIIQGLQPKTEWECIIDEQGKLKLI